MVILGLLTAAILFIGRSEDVFGNRYPLVTLMKSAAGLVPGAAVQLAGQNVGQVTEVRLISPGKRPPTGEPVAVWMAVDRLVQDQVRTDSRAQVRTQGLLGDRIIDISPGTTQGEVLQPGDTVVSAASLDYDLLLQEGAAAVSGLAEVSENLADLTRKLLEGEGTFGQMIADETLYQRFVELTTGLERLLSAGTSDKSSLGRLLRDDQLYTSLVGAVASFDTLTEGVMRGEGSLGKLMRSDSLYVTLQDVVGRSDSLLAGLEGGEGAAGRLLTDDRLYEELLKTLVQLNDLLSAVRENPEKYVPPVKVF